MEGHKELLYAHRLHRGMETTTRRPMIPDSTHPIGSSASYSELTRTAQANTPRNQTHNTHTQGKRQPHKDTVTQNYYQTSLQTAAVQLHPHTCCTGHHNTTPSTLTTHATHRVRTPLSSLRPSPVLLTPGRGCAAAGRDRLRWWWRRCRCCRWRRLQWSCSTSAEPTRAEGWAKVCRPSAACSTCSRVR